MVYLSRFYFLTLTTIFSSFAVGTTLQDIHTRKIGSPFTANYSIYFENSQGVVISPFHDIPLSGGMVGNDQTFNMVVEIPRWTNAKFEINKETALNPIKQDLTKDTKQPRFVHNVYPFKGYPWNYGAFPQTWEDPNHPNKDTGYIGDNDPIDVIEIGDEIATTGQLKQVKLLGVFGLIDQDETDWKIVVIDINDPLAKVLNDIDDVEKYKPGLLKDTARFFSIYKIPKGGKMNTIAFDSKPQNKKYATQLVYETHESWRALVNGTSPKATIHTENLSVPNSPYKISPTSTIVASVAAENQLTPAPLPKTLDIWTYVMD